MAKVTLGNQIRAVEREVRMRQEVYGRRVAGGAMRKAVADWEIEAIKAALETLKAVEEVEDELRALLVAKRAARP